MEEIDELKNEFIASLFKDKTSVDNFKVIKTLFKTLLSYIDLTTDVLFFFDLIKKADKVFRALAIA